MAFITERSKKQPKGVIGYASGSLGRYREFDACLNMLQVPPESPIYQAAGINVAFNYNQILREMLKGDYQWAWLLGDDHVFPPELLLNLLERNVDVVTPFCLTRQEPFTPVVYEFDGKDYKNVGIDEFRGMSGLARLKSIQVCGNAGVLIRRNVCEAIPDPWFENGMIDREKNSSDLWFSKKVNDALFGNYVDLDNPMGHISHFAVWPHNDNGRWKTNVTSL